MPERSLSDLDARLGETRKTVEGLRVEAGKVAEFAHALRDSNSIHHDTSVAVESGFEDRPAPLTFTRTSYFPRYRPDGIDEGAIQGFDLGFEERYTVHGEQAYEFERPLIVGDRLSAETTLVDAFQRDGSRGGTMTFAVLETVYRDQADDSVVTARSTVIETGGAIEDDADGRDAEETRSDGEDAGPDTFGAAPFEETLSATDRSESPLRAADVAVGDAGPPLVVSDLERTDFVKYAGASGDFTPIHYDEPAVRAAGHESVFAQGMLTAGLAARLVVGWFGLANITRFQTRFQAQLFPGEHVLVDGEVTDVSRSDASTTVVASFEATTPDGRVLLAGEAEANLPPA